ncbi:MAG TPA: acylneuraminate cytidylyltransferase family protein [Ignavibacteria bacterium]|nr:acylneuraminate cytidylyltransferase family protein [Ignavibacteria bacterium]
MKILSIIPARSGSKGIPGKNIKILGNKPLIAYSIISSLKCNFISDTIVSTDSEKIAKISMNYGAWIPFLRPKKLSKDKTPTLPVIQYTLSRLSKMGYNYDAVCLLQPTSPFRNISFLNSCLKTFLKNKPDSLISVRVVPDEYNPHWVFESNEKGFLKISTGENKIIPRRQELPKAYYRDGSVYITSINCICEKKSLYGEKISYRINNSEDYCNLDTLSDWKLAEKLVKKRI